MVQGFEVPVFVLTTFVSCTLVLAVLVSLIRVATCERNLQPCERPDGRRASPQENAYTEHAQVRKIDLR